MVECMMGTARESTICMRLTYGHEFALSNGYQKIIQPHECEFLSLMNYYRVPLEIKLKSVHALKQDGPGSHTSTHKYGFNQGSGFTMEMGSTMEIGFTVGMGGNMLRTFSINVQMYTGPKHF